MNVVSSGSYPAYPIVQIHKQDIKLDIKQDPGSVEIEQPKADVDRQTTPRQLTIEYRQGDLQIDQSRAWDALGLANNLEVMNRIFDNAPQVFLQGLAAIVEKGNQMAAIHKSTNVIAEQAANVRMSAPELNVVGPASRLNVDIRYTAKKPKIDIQEAEINTNVQVNPPRYQHHPSNVGISVLQYPSIRYTPPQIDLRM